jgi:hypothetical protein
MMLPLPIFLCACLDFHSLAFPNLDFRSGAPSHWEGEGFAVVPVAQASLSAPEYAVTSADRDEAGHKALLHRVIVLPRDAGVIHFNARIASSASAKDKLDVALLAAGKRFIPKQVRTSTGWLPAKELVAAKDGEWCEYIWRVEAYAGQSVRIVLVDEDDHPGACLYCSGFHVESAALFQEREFEEYMDKLVRQHGLGQMSRYDSAHFTALTNAEEGFSENRVSNCEMLYGLFFAHFLSKGFVVRQPRTKLMLALFDSQSGFEAYLGHKMSPNTTGIYDPETNRFVMYDYGQNESYLSQKHQSEREVRRIDSYFPRQQYLGTLNRHAQDVRGSANLRTIMHEAAHQLSFNSGMLNREGDIPLWLAEGLACYCESTANGAWQGIGETNPGRITTLARTLANKTPLIPSRDLLEGDNWVRGQRDATRILLGYAQSWALFRMLMEEQPSAVRTYFNLIYSRQTSERRLADFQQAFGADVRGMDQRHNEYIRRLVADSPD